MGQRNLRRSTPDAFHTERKKRIWSVIQIWENLLRETEGFLQIEKLGTDGTELQNRQKEMKAVLEEKQKNIRQQTSRKKKKQKQISGKENRYSLCRNL